MPYRLRKVAFFLFLICLVPSLALAQRQGRLLGKIVDPDGNPIPGVVVTTTCKQIPSFKDIETTDKKGMFKVDFNQVDVTYVYRLDKAGFQTMQIEQNWSLVGTQHFEWTMRQGQSAVASGAAPPASTSEPAIAAFNAGVAALKAKEHATAVTKFKEAVADDPKLRQAWEALATLHLDLGHNQEAVDAAEKAMALGSTEPAILTARWQAYRNLGDETKAAEAQKDLVRVGQQTEQAKKLHNEGVALSKAGDEAGAFAKYQEALKLDPNLQATQLALATAGVKIGKYAEAEAATEGVLKADPKNEQAVRLRYNACLGLGDKAKLADALMGLAAFEPVKARDGILRLAFDAYDANDMPLAKQRFNEALKIDPNYPLAHYYLGLINVGEGATAEARMHFERFLQLAPNDKEAESAREALKFLK